MNHFKFIWCLLPFFTCNLNSIAILQHSNISKVDNDLTVLYEGNDQMIIVYREQDASGNILIGYDMHFTKGFLDSIIYIQDTIRVNVLYKRIGDGNWEMKFSNTDDFRYPHKTSTHALFHGGVNVQSDYKFTVQLEEKEEIISSISQRRNKSDEKHGLQLYFKEGNPKSMFIFISSGEIGPTAQFNRRGKIKALTVKDPTIKNRYNYQFARFKYSRGKLRRRRT